MTEKANRICTICARGGSKGIPGKNLRPLLGKPLLFHTIEQAQASECFDAIAVSSDSDEILAAAQKAGIGWLIVRPAELATDLAAKIPVIRHCVSEVERRRGSQFDVVVDLDVTAPIRSQADIQLALGALSGKDVENVITGVPSRKSPYFNLVEINDAGFVSLSKQPGRGIVRRQDVPTSYDMNASIYVWHRRVLFERDQVIGPGTKLHVMSAAAAIDIDSEMDFDFVEFVMTRQSRKTTG